MLCFSNIKCSLNIQDSSFFSMALKIGKNASEFSEKKKILDSYLKFDDVLAVPVDQKALSYEVQKKQKCEIMLYRFMNSQTRQSKHLVGIGSITVTNEFLKSNNRQIKITNMLDNEAFVQCRIKIKLPQSLQIFQLNESKISQIESKSHNESSNSLSDLKIHNEKDEKTNFFSQTIQKRKNASVIQIPSRLSETCNIKSKNSLQEKIYSDPYLQKIQFNSQEKLLGNGSEKTQNMRQDFKKTNSRIITENDQLLTQKSLQNPQNEPLMQLCMNLQNQNNTLMTKIMQLQVSQQSNKQEVSSKKDPYHKNLCINQPISVAYRPVIKNVRFQQNQTNRSISQSQVKSQKSYSRFNSKGKYLAIGVMKDKDSLNQYKIYKKQISTQTLEENLFQQTNFIKQDIFNLKNSNEYKLNINGINFQDCTKQKQPLYTKRTSDNDSRNSTFTTYEPINIMIEEKYKKNQKFLKKYNEKLTQQIKKLKDQNKKLLQETSGKKFVTMEKYDQLNKKCQNQQNQIKSLLVKIKEKDGKIQQLQVKIIEVESEKIKLGEQFKQQRKSIAYFLKTSHFIDEKLKEHSVGPLNRQIEMHIKALSNNNLGKKGLKTINSGEFDKIIQTKMNSPFNKFSQMNPMQEGNKFTRPTPRNEKYENYFTSRTNAYNNQLLNNQTMSEEEKSRIPRKFSQQNNFVFEQASMKLYQSHKMKGMNNQQKNQYRKKSNTLYDNPAMYISGFMGTGQTIIQTFGMKSDL